MSLEYIRNYYGVPATVGQLIRYTGGKEPKEGWIAGAESARLLVKYPGVDEHDILHPTREIEYLGDPNV